MLSVDDTDAPVATKMCFLLLISLICVYFGDAFLAVFVKVGYNF